MEERTWSFQRLNTPWRLQRYELTVLTNMFLWPSLENMAVTACGSVQVLAEGVQQWRKIVADPAVAAILDSSARRIAGLGV